MKPLVFNATPLIYMIKVGLSEVFEDLKNEKLTSPQVKREVVDEGKRKGVPDAIILERMFQNNVFKVTEPENKKFLATLLETRGLHVTDAEVLAIARERDGIAVIDDEVARKIARIYGISYAGTPYLLMRAVVQRLITKERAKQAINEMVFAGWRCGIESYVKIMEAIEKLCQTLGTCGKLKKRNDVSWLKRKQRLPISDIVSTWETQHGMIKHHSTLSNGCEIV